MKPLPYGDILGPMLQAYGGQATQLSDGSWIWDGSISIQGPIDYNLRPPSAGGTPIFGLDEAMEAAANAPGGDIMAPVEPFKEKFGSLEKAFFEGLLYPYRWMRIPSRKRDENMPVYKVSDLWDTMNFYYNTMAVQGDTPPADVPEPTPVTPPPITGGGSPINVSYDYGFDYEGMGMSPQRLGTSSLKAAMEEDFTNPYK